MDGGSTALSVHAVPSAAGACGEEDYTGSSSSSSSEDGVLAGLPPFTSNLFTKRSGRLFCPREAGGCGARVGGFSWEGSGIGQHTAVSGGGSRYHSRCEQKGELEVTLAPLIFLHASKCERRSIQVRALG